MTAIALSPIVKEEARGAGLLEWLSIPRARVRLTLYGWTPRVPQIFRLHVPPSARVDLDRHVFVEAASRYAARRKTARALAVVEDCSAHQVEREIADVLSAQECLKVGLSEDRDLRLFETRWRAPVVTHFVSHPVFLLPVGAVLIRKWALVPGVTRWARE
jgi:hypothetical protein